MKIFAVFMLLGLLSACSGLDSKSSQLEIGSSKADVLRIMGTSPYPDSHNDILAWRYAARVGLGYCDYKEIYIYRDRVIHINQYYHASVAGCTVGLQKIDWGPVVTKVDELEGE